VGGIMPLAELEKRQIFAALAHTQGNRTHAARLLGISIRTLRNKLHEYNGEVSGETQAAAAAVG
jgi:two-component system, response regulator FlrC